MWTFLYIILPLVLLILVFGTGRFFPVENNIKQQQASYQPPGWVFGVAWTYTTIVLGLLWAICTHLTKNFWLLLWPFALTIIWCVWIVNEYYKNRTFKPIFKFFSTFLLIASGCLLAVNMAELRSHLSYKSYVILPSVCWLFLATSLNGYGNHLCANKKNKRAYTSTKSEKKTS